MKNTLNWLHISDVHFHPGTEWRDSKVRRDLISFLKSEFASESIERPDLIFCTGDIAFGETTNAPLEKQYEAAEEFFNELLSVCGEESQPLNVDRLFVVPGNHDVNRKAINQYAQSSLVKMAEQSLEYNGKIHKDIENRSKEFMDAMERLDAYELFIKKYLSHQEDKERRHVFAKVVDIDGLKVGVAGFNSAWSCAGPEDDRNVWLAAEWQFNFANEVLHDADIRIGLVHHPIDWLTESDRNLSTVRISTDFDFWIHGHVHNAWVIPSQSHVIVASGAIGAEKNEEFGINVMHLNFTDAKCAARIYSHNRGQSGWTMLPIAVHAPYGVWNFDTPIGLKERIASKFKTTADSAANIPADECHINQQTEPHLKQVFRLYGRNALLEKASNQLKEKHFLLLYGLRGNGKSVLIEELGKMPPLAGKEFLRITVAPETTAIELFRQLCTLLGDTSEYPSPPTGDQDAIMNEIARRYSSPRPAWIWIDRAHHLLDERGFCLAEIRDLFLGLQAALGNRWYWVFELRERPPQKLLNEAASECEVMGLDKNSLAEWLVNSAPEEQKTQWRYSGRDLKYIYQLLGGGHGDQAHPLATDLLIKVAYGMGETPLDVLRRHRGSFDDDIETSLLGELFSKVLSPLEQTLLLALSLYRTSIPHDHADCLENKLKISGAWNGLDRRCLLTASADHSQYYLHNFISSWLRARKLGYTGDGDNPEADLGKHNPPEVIDLTRSLHSSIAACWLEDLKRSGRVSSLNITRALEGFHHLMAAGETDRLQEIALDLLKGNLDWARRRMKDYYEKLYKQGAPNDEQLAALEFRAILDPNDHSVHRFLGQCWQKEEGDGSERALRCFEKACELDKGFPPYLADLGKTLLARGSVGAMDFLARLEILEVDFPKAINDHVLAIKYKCLDFTDQTKASALRMEKITSGSRNPAFYTDEADARQNNGDLQGALEILSLANENGCGNVYTETKRTSILRLLNPI